MGPRVGRGGSLERLSVNLKSEIEKFIFIRIRTRYRARGAGDQKEACMRDKPTIRITLRLAGAFRLFFETLQASDKV